MGDKWKYLLRRILWLRAAFNANAESQQKKRADPKKKKEKRKIALNNDLFRFDRIARAVSEFSAY